MTYAYIHNQIPLIQKTYDLYKFTHQYSKTFPKSDKYCLGEKIKNIILETLELLAEAETAKKDWKLTPLEKAGYKINLLKLLIRLCNEIKILDNRKYLTLQEMLQEIGRMIGGWIKAVK
jgi:hypothetical protein